jgi:hypothetical protein
VRTILRRLINPDDPDYGESVQQFAERAQTSTRSVYRVLSGSSSSSTDPPTLLLETADRLLTAAGAHLNDTRVLTEDGRLIPYWDT